jgi:PBP1b-binding outer membrane lipoprotein LpoB
MIHRLALVAGLAALLAACSSEKKSASDASQSQEATEATEAADRAKLCADPAWKQDHLGVWFNLCRNTAGN